MEFARVRLGFAANAQQAEVLRSRAKRGILNCSRQWGKSTVTAAKALFRVFARPGCLVVVASPSRRQSAEWMRKAKKMVARMGIAVRGDGDNDVSLLLPSGDIWLLSTPRGKSGFFYETWAYGGPEWLKVSGPATECPQIPREFLEEQRSVMGGDAFRQEHLCEFVGSGEAVFERELIEAALDDGVEPV